MDLWTKRTRAIVPVAIAVASALALPTTPGLAADGGARAQGAHGRSAGGAISAWGDNSGGELGDGSFEQSDSPVAVAGVSGARAIAAGYRFSLAVMPRGRIDAWGENQFGELGDGSTKASDLPVRVKGLGGVVAIAAGGGHSLALLRNGKVMAWGYNAFGQLGVGTTKDRSRPVPVKRLRRVKAIAAGQLDSLALLSDGKVEAWGDDRDGELGNGTFGADSSLPVPVQGLKGVKAISAGGLFNLALLRNGHAKAWGQGDSGQLGNGQETAQDAPVTVTGLGRASAISAGEDFALALRRGNVWAWGDNSFDELGDPAAGAQSDVPVQIPGLAHVKAIAAGGESGIALLSSGKLESWGDNAVGQLGNGTTTFVATPKTVPKLSGARGVADGVNHALALDASSARTRRGPSDTWRVARTPNTGSHAGLSDVFFDSVSAAGATDAWAVGTSQNPGGNPFPVAAHWNGRAWKAVPMPAPSGLEATLAGVRDFGPSDAWAVGDTTDPATLVERTLIERWNGSTWNIVPSPNPQGGSGNDELGAIDGVSRRDVCAAGFDFAPNEPLTLLFERWNGSSWVAAPSPPLTGADVADGLTTITAKDAWAVGTNGFEATLAAHWNGKRWTIVPTPTPMNGRSPTNQLTGVTAVTSKNVWASGYEDNVGGRNFRKPYFLHWNGHTWRLVLAHNAGTEGSLLRGVTALSATDIWAVGQTQEEDGSILTLTERFNGHAWKPVPSPDPGEVGTLVSNTLSSISAAGRHTLLAVGSQETLGKCCTRTLALQASSAR